MEELQNEISQFSCKHLIKCDNDATSHVSVHSESEIRYSENATLVMAKTLEEAKYKPKTNLGVTEEFHQHSELHPIYWTSQGSSNSPIIWVLVSSVLFTCHEAKAHGTKWEIHFSHHNDRFR